MFYTCEFISLYIFFVRRFYFIEMNWGCSSCAMVGRRRGGWDVGVNCGGLRYRVSEFISVFEGGIFGLRFKGYGGGDIG